MDEAIYLRRKVIKVVLVVVLVVVLIVFGDWLYNYLNTTSVSVVTGNSNNYVSITPIVNGVLDSQKAYTQQHSLTERVHYGQYQISVFNHSDHLNRTVAITSSSQKYFVINLSGFSVPPYPVYGNTINSLSANSSQLSFLQPSRGLGAIGSNNKAVFLSGSSQAKSVYWADPTLGIMEDSLGNLSLVQNGQLKTLVLPFNKTLREVYAISSSGNIYLASGGNLYQGIGSGNYSKIYSLPNNILGIDVVGNKIALVVGSNGFNPDSTGNIVVISPGISPVRSKIVASSVKWSSDGNYLAAFSNKGVVLLNSSLKVIYTIPNNGVLYDYAWGANDNLYYSQGGTLWDYSINNNESFQISQTSGQSNIAGIFAGQSGNYVYITVDNSSGLNGTASGTQLYRIGLNKQPENYTLGALSVALPAVLDGVCSANYVNFTKATINVNYPQNISQQYCSGAINSLLTQYNISPTLVNVVYYPYVVS